MSSHVARIASLTRRLAQTSITSSSSLSSSCSGAIASSMRERMATSSASSSSIGLLTNQNYRNDIYATSFTSARWMSSSSKDDSKKSNEDNAESSNTQHEEWVKFQQSIAVDGFNTGQTTKVTKFGLTGRKHRGGKQMRKRKEKELELQKREDEFAAMGGGQFPTLRYSDEETERLLREAYAAIPPRAGPRRSRHLKRERIRWWRVRKIRKTLKKQKIAAHFRRMEKRSRIIKEVLAVKAGADEVRGVDEEYQKEVLKQWVLRNLLVEDEGEEQKMMIGGGDVGAEEEVEGKNVDEAGLAIKKEAQKN